MQHPGVKEDDMNGSQRMCSDLWLCAGVCLVLVCVCGQPFRVVEGLKGSVNHLVEG